MILFFIGKNDFLGIYNFYILQDKNDLKLLRYTRYKSPTTANVRSSRWKSWNRRQTLKFKGKIDIETETTMTVRQMNSLISTHWLRSPLFLQLYW